MGSPSQPTAHTPVEQPNTLVSNSIVKIQDLLCEGPISGFFVQSGIYGNDPLTSVYFDEVPARNLDGSYNFNASGSGFAFNYTLGTTGQGLISGFEKVEVAIPLSSNRKVSYPIPGDGDIKNVVALINTTSYPDADAVKVTIKTPAMSSTDISNGDTNGVEIGWRVDIYTNNNPTPITYTHYLDGKCTAPYLSTNTYTLPKTNPPQNYYEWRIKVYRITQDFASVAIQNELYVDSICVISSSSFVYPNTALATIKLGADQFSAIPVRSYDIMGMLISIPNGYKPISINWDGTITPASYPNVWDGSFNPVKTWTSNPAWIMYDLLTNKRYGLGNYIKTDWVDKWTLYEIAQYCDEMVDDGSGTGTLEPRFTCNVVLQQRTDAYNLLLNLSSIFRGMLYWANGRLFTTRTDEGSPIFNFTNANVINGIFNYSDTAKNTRSTIIKVRWTDPSNFYRENLEYIEDTNGILKYGYIQKDVTAFGCTSQGQARRIGNWILQTEQLLTETITFQVGMDGNYLRPGDVFNVFDNYRMNRQQGGRVSSFSGSALTLDRPVDLTPGYTYSLSVVNPKFNFETTGDITGSSQISQIRNSQIEDKQVLTSAGSGIQTLTVNSNYSNLNNGAIWILQVSGIAPSIFQQPVPYKCLALSDVNGNLEVLGLNYRTGINYLSETGYSIITQPINSGDHTPILPPSNLVITQSTGLLYNNDFYRYYRLNWTDSPSANLSYYVVSGKAGTSGVWANFSNPRENAASYPVDLTGIYSFQVAAVSNNNVYSTFITGSSTILPLNPLSHPRIQQIFLSNNYDRDLKNQSGYYTGYLGQSPTISWILPTDLNGNQAAENQFISGYNFRILDPVTNENLLPPVVLPYGTYDYKLNSSIFQSFIHGQQRDLKIYIETIDIFGTVSSGGAFLIDNPPPSLNNSVATFYGNQENLHYNIITSPQDGDDLSGIYIWYDTNLNSPTLNNVKLITDNFAGTINTNISNSGYYAWWAPIDTFGATGCNISVPYPITITNVNLPSGVRAAFSGLSGALSQALVSSTGFLGSTINTLSGSLNILVSSGILSGINYTNSVFSTVSGLTGVTGMTALVTGEALARINGDNAEASFRNLALAGATGYITGISGSLYTNTIAQVASEATTRSNADIAEASMRNSVAAQLTGYITGISGAASAYSLAIVNSEASTRATADISEATQRNLVASQLTGYITGISGANYSISQALVNSEATTRSTNDASEATQRNLVAAQLTGYVATVSGVVATNAQALISAETSARTTADSAEVSARNTAIAQFVSTGVTVSGITGNLASIAYVNAETTARSNADAAEATQRNLLASSMTGYILSVSGGTTNYDNFYAQSLVNSEATTRSTADSTEATQRNLLASTLTGYIQLASGGASNYSNFYAQSLVNSEASTRSTAISTEATQRNLVASNLSGYAVGQASTAYSNASALVTNEANTRISQDNILSNSISTVSANLGTTQSTVTTLANAFITGGVPIARWGMQAQADGTIVGIQAIAQGGMNPISAVKIQSNIFQITSVVNGVTLTPFTVSSDSSKIVIGLDLQSDNYVSQSAGYSLVKSAGTAEFAGGFRVGNSISYLSFANSNLILQTNDGDGNQVYINRNLVELWSAAGGIRVVPSGGQSNNNPFIHVRGQSVSTRIDADSISVYSSSQFCNLAYNQLVFTSPGLIGTNGNTLTIDTHSSSTTFTGPTLLNSYLNVQGTINTNSNYQIGGSVILTSSALTIGQVNTNTITRQTSHSWNGHNWGPILNGPGVNNISFSWIGGNLYANIDDAAQVLLG